MVKYISIYRVSPEHKVNKLLIYQQGNQFQLPTQIFLAESSTRRCELLILVFPSFPLNCNTFVASTRVFNSSCFLFKLPNKKPEARRSMPLFLLLLLVSLVVQVSSKFSHWIHCKHFRGPSVHGRWHKC